MWQFCLSVEANVNDFLWLALISTTNDIREMKIGIGKKTYNILHYSCIDDGLAKTLPFHSFQVSSSCTIHIHAVWDTKWMDLRD